MNVALQALRLHITANEIKGLLKLNLTGVRGKKLKKLINIPSFSNTNPNDA